MFDMPDFNAMQAFADLGASPNAFTSNAMTGYYFSTTNEFQKCLELLLQFVCTPYFTEESVQKERGIIGQEIHMIEDDPDSRCYLELNQALFQNHPIRISIAGSVESIAEITPDTLYDCYHAFYRPNNMVLTVVGNFNPEEVVRTAERLLPQENGECVVANMGCPEPPEVVKARVETPMEVGIPSFLIGYKCASPGDGLEGMINEYCGELAADLLAGPSSDLYAKLYEEGLIDKQFYTNYSCSRGAAVLSFGGKSQNPDKVAERISERVRQMIQEGIDLEYFQRRKKAGFGSVVRMFDSFENVCVQLADCFFKGENPYQLPEVFDRLTPEAVLTFLERNLTDWARSVSVISPIKGA